MADMPHIVVTHNSAATSLLLRAGSAIDLTPTTGLNQVTTVGDTAERSDQRTPQVIWTDQRGGAGVRYYTETEGLTGFTISTCDVRHPGMIALPPAATTLGVSGLPGATPAFVEYLGVTDAYLIAWAYGSNAANSARRYDDTGATWNDVQTGGTDITNLTGFASFNGYYCFATTNGTKGLYTSTDALTWADSAKAKACIGLCVHDNKLWTFIATDPTAAHASWGTSSAFYGRPGEVVRQVVEWRDRVGRAAIYVVTTQRVVWYDEDADAFLTFFDMARLVNPTTSHPRLAIHPGDGSAILTLYDTTAGAASDRAYQFTGVTTPIGPNQRGGLPTTYGNTITTAVGNSRWMFFALNPRGAATLGAFWALNEQGGWAPVNGQGGAIINGLGYGQGKLFGLIGTTCYEIAVGDSWDTPLNAAGSYAVSGVHEFAFTDGGTPSMHKQALWVEVQCLDHTSADKVPGLATGATLAVAYRTDEEAAWTTLDTLTDADTFPATLPINGGDGVAFRQIKVRLTLGTASPFTSTPVVTSTALAYIRQEEPKYAYTVTVDLRDMEDQPLYAGLDRGQLLARIAAWTQPGAVVKLEFAGADWVGTDPVYATTVANCTVSYRASADPEEGIEQLTLQFVDVSPPS